MSTRPGQGGPGSGPTHPAAHAPVCPVQGTATCAFFAAGAERSALLATAHPSSVA